MMVEKGMEKQPTDLQNVSDVTDRPVEVIGGKEIFLLGTAHVSARSVKQVRMAVEELQPDTICVELCNSRYEAVCNPERWRSMDIVKVIRQNKAFLLLAQMLLVSFQRRIADQLGVQPGGEMIEAVRLARESGAELCLADREINVTLARTWRSADFVTRIKIFFSLVAAIFSTEEIDDKAIEEMKKEDMLESILSEVEKAYPAVRKYLIDERDRYMASKIRHAPGKRILAVVGAGHLPGIRKYLHEPDPDMDALEAIPPKKGLGKLIPWMIPALIVLLVIYGFVSGGMKATAAMAGWWITANAAFAALGALAAFGHPYTILASALAAPITSLNPMIAAGWVAGLVEAYVRKPQVKDFEDLSKDIMSLKGFWRNNVTRILLVVAFANLGSVAGTFVAIPLMARVMGG